MNKIILIMTILIIAILGVSASYSEREVAPFVANEVCENILTSLHENPSKMIINGVRALDTDLSLDEAKAYILGRDYSDDLEASLLETAEDNYQQDEKMLRRIVEIDYSSEGRFKDIRSNFYCTFHVDIFDSTKITSITYDNKKYDDLTTVFLLNNVNKEKITNGTYEIEFSFIDRVNYLFSMVI